MSGDDFLRAKFHRSRGDIYEGEVLLPSQIRPVHGKPWCMQQKLVRSRTTHRYLPHLQNSLILPLSLPLQIRTYIKSPILLCANSTPEKKRHRNRKLDGCNGAMTRRACQLLQNWASKKYSTTRPRSKYPCTKKSAIRTDLQLERLLIDVDALIRHNDVRLLA